MNATRKVCLFFVLRSLFFVVYLFFCFAFCLFRLLIEFVFWFCFVVIVEFVFCLFFFFTFFPKAYFYIDTFCIKRHLQA